jgi:hypothetical protein
MHALAIELFTHAGGIIRLNDMYFIQMTTRGVAPTACQV